MVLAKDGIKTRVWIVPYEESSIDRNAFLLPSTGQSIEVESVEGYADTLVKITLSDGHYAIVKADHLLTVVKKCVTFI